MNDKKSMIYQSDIADTTVISDDINLWNNGSCYNPKIDVNQNGDIFVVWEDTTFGEHALDTDILCAYFNNNSWSNATIISDNDSRWTNDYNRDPDIIVDNNGVAHVVYMGCGESPWGDGHEIWYTNYLDGYGWSNATCISDGYMGVNWNNDQLENPSITMDDSGNLYVSFSAVYMPSLSYEAWIVKGDELLGWSNVTLISNGYQDIYWNDGWAYATEIVAVNDYIYIVWEEDYSAAQWGSDIEIMGASFSFAEGISNVSIISDNGNWWNNLSSENVQIAADRNGNLHAVWVDDTDGPWGTDREIFYAKFIPYIGWTNITVISENGGFLNSGYSGRPDIAVDDYGNIHVVWYDGTDGWWGNKSELMYRCFQPGKGWLDINIISDWTSNGDKGYPSIAIENNEKIHIVWIETNEEGWWGDDSEILYMYFSINSDNIDGINEISGFRIIFTVLSITLMASISFLYLFLRNKSTIVN